MIWAQKNVALWACDCSDSRYGLKYLGCSRLVFGPDLYTSRICKHILYFKLDFYSIFHIATTIFCQKKNYHFVTTLAQHFPENYKNIV